jgi:biotin-(acetyl-CoA carboxylase) ligase
MATLPHSEPFLPSFLVEARPALRQIPGFQHHSLLYVPETGSTNDDLKALVRHEPFSPTVLIAGHQHAGRGQNANRWLDLPPGSDTQPNSFLCSFHWNTPAIAFPLSLIAGLAVYQGISEGYGKQPDLWLKWPNDLMLGSAKIGGLLLESLSYADKPHDGAQISKKPRMAFLFRDKSLVIVGIGINFTPPPAETAGKQSAGLAPFDVEHRFAGLLTAILSAWSHLLQGSPVAWQRLFRQHSRPFWNRRIEYGSHDRRRTARTIDLNPDGSLLVFDEQEKGRCDLHSALGISFLDVV